MLCKACTCMFLGHIPLGAYSPRKAGCSWGILPDVDSKYGLGTRLETVWDWDQKWHWNETWNDPGMRPDMILEWDLKFGQGREKIGWDSTINPSSPTSTQPIQKAFYTKGASVIGSLLKEVGGGSKDTRIKVTNHVLFCPRRYALHIIGHQQNS